VKVFQNRLPRRIIGQKRDALMGVWRKPHNEGLHDMYSSLNIMRIIMSRRIRRPGHIAQMGEKRNMYSLMVRKPEGERSLGRSRRRWIDNIKMTLLEIGWSGVDWICLAQDRCSWSALANAIMNLRIP
jgi:hypothetical protein